MKVQSLRARLILIILTPLLVFAIVAAAWQFRLTSARAAEIFDRGLLSAALAISRDVAISDGDALSPATRRLVSDTSGGELFYHVFAPDGVFVTGYATPPPPPRLPEGDEVEPFYFDASYQGRPVRVLRFPDATTVDGITGLFTVSVWQDMSARTGFVREVLARTVGMIVLLVMSVAFIVWFGVGLGLRPLLELEDAIARRTARDLTPIRRSVPMEAKGIVATFNDLLDRVSRRISSKDEFISNAAHQLRNPIAGVLALAEAAENAPTPEAAKTRSTELVAAARDAAHLTNQLLSFERARGADIKQTGDALDLTLLCSTLVQTFKSQHLKSRPDVRMSKVLPAEPVHIFGDRVMLQEAILNLLANALAHGGATLSHIQISLQARETEAELIISDDGVGISEESQALAMSRFAQANSGPGSGLGLPIAIRVAENHGGELRLMPKDIGLSVVLSLPLQNGSTREL